MKISGLLTGVLLLALSVDALACGNIIPSSKKWFLPDGTKYVIDTNAVAFAALGIPRDVQATQVRYRAGKFMFRSPSGEKLFWEIRDAIVLKYHDKPFAFVTNVYYPLLDKRGQKLDEAGCVSKLVIYDEDGDGKFESVASSYNSCYEPSLHVPSWTGAPKQMPPPPCSSLLHPAWLQLPLPPVLPPER